MATIQEPTFETLDAVHRSEGFKHFALSYLVSEGGRSASETFNEERFTAKGTDVTYRVANHWGELGLIECQREGEKGWRKFSIIDLVWIKIIVQLRNFGYSLEKLKYVKAHLIDRKINLTDGSASASFLEFYVAFAAIQRRPTYLLVFADGNAEPLFYDEYQDYLRQLTFNYIHINLNALLQELFPKIDHTPRFDKTISVNDDELEVLFLLRTGNFDSITIKHRNGRIEQIEAEESVDVGKQLEEIMREQDYQDITVKRHRGKITRITRTLKKRVGVR